MLSELSYVPSFYSPICIYLQVSIFKFNKELETYETKLILIWNISLLSYEKSNLRAIRFSYFVHDSLENAQKAAYCCVKFDIKNLPCLSVLQTQGLKKCNV